MDAMHKELFLELRQTREEIINSLNKKQENEWIQSILEQELADITSAMGKIQNGNFGQCEESGQPLPEYLLKVVPTVKTLRDSEILEHYYRKPIYSSFF